MGAKPLVPPEVAGSLNFRGHIITALDLRDRLGLPGRNNVRDQMNIVVFG
jgi:purine-binding chemotaxis protein CheW